MKGWTHILSLIAFLLLSTVLVTTVSASVPSGEATAVLRVPAPAVSGTSVATGRTFALTIPVTTTIHTTFLPLALVQHRYPRVCSSDSPFSLQIAALHQVTPRQRAGDGVDSMTEAEWMAWYDAAFPTLVDALIESGACWTRLRIDWSLIQPDPPPAEYVWGPYHDEKLALVAGSGLQIIATVDSAPLWAAYSAAGPVYPEQLGNMAQFLTDLVNRYKQPPYNIHHWELFNEPDWSIPDGTWGWGMRGGEYAVMVSVAHAAIKAADPQATVLMGGIAYDWFTEYGGPFYRYFVDDVMTAAGDLYMDALNFHYFPDFAAEWERWESSLIPATCGVVDDGVGTPYEAAGIDVIAKVNHFRNRMATCHEVSLPIWLTEIGEHGYMDDPPTLEQQARYVIQGQVRALAAGVQNVTWHALVDPPYYPYEQGLLDSTFAPKPAFYSYQTLTRELDGYTYSHTLHVQGLEAYVFVDDEAQSKIVAWAWGEPLQPAYLALSGTSQVRRADRHGNVTYVVDGGAGDADGIVDGSILIELPAPPVDPEPDPYRFTAEPLFLSP